MPVQTPPEIPPAPPDAWPEVESGVIEDARARQSRHRRIAGWLLAATIAAGALIAALGGGGGGAGGSGAGNAPGGHGAGGGAAHAAAGRPFPGAPSTQPNGYGVAGDTCPLAPRNRYLPARSGCVTVRHADIDGDARSDLVLVYSRLSRNHPCCYLREPAPPRHEFTAEGAFLKVVFPDGASVTRRISGTRLTRAAAIDAIAHVNGEPGDEIFLEVERISSGATVVAYGLHAGRLVPAGVMLESGGDSGYHAGFDCLTGDPQRLVQRSFLLIGPTIYGWWKESEATYTWHGLRLVKTAERSFRHHGGPARGQISIGHGCTAGVH